MFRPLRHFLMGLLAAALLLEAALQLLPVSTTTQTGYYTDENILTYPPGHEWTVSTGWDLKNARQLKSNNFGFVAQHDFKAGSNAIALIGDSYVEASMLPSHESPAAQLESLLRGRPVYAMGGPGSSLLDYAERLRFAHRVLGLRTAVMMLESTDASQAICGSGNIHAHCLKADTFEPSSQTLPPPGWLKRTLRHSATAQYLTGHLRLSAVTLFSRAFWSSGTEQHGVAPSATELNTERRALPLVLPEQRRQRIDAVLAAFVAQIKSLDGVRLIVAIDMNRKNLDRPNSEVDESQYLAGQLKAAGFEVVHSEPLFRQHASQSRLSLAVGPYDAHLNALGIRILMSAVADVIAHSDNTPKEN
jgi:hypothetical protein